jgi:hypothetical protein
MAQNRRSYLDALWHNGGADYMKRFFVVMAAKDRDTLLRNLNDERLSFPAFFVIMKDLNRLGSFSELSPRNLAALQICADKMTIPGWEAGDIIDHDVLHEALLWMFNTGRNWEGPSRGRDEFDMMIDYTASLLVITYDDRTVLPDIADIIFRRNRRGLFIHDLVWCFFQTLDRESPILIAWRLLSTERSDVELACRLLHLETPAVYNRAEMQKKFDEYVKWLAENRPFLYLTGEHFQQMSDPKHFDFDMEAKYLGKEISPRDKTSVEPLSEEEGESLKSFRTATDRERKMLTDFSYKLRSRNMRQWDEWMRRDIGQQVFAAQAGYEVLR